MLWLCLVALVAQPVFLAAHRHAAHNDAHAALAIAEAPAPSSCVAQHDCDSAPEPTRPGPDHHHEHDDADCAVCHYLASSRVALVLIAENPASTPALCCGLVTLPDAPALPRRLDTPAQPRAPPIG
ncbi:MAG: hypothetical protein EA379_03505 [Phycisphaerales bacterium]|nr:MAG: hypothetical protein EA379_03505 [Phycisphaerales bacterium]